MGISLEARKLQIIKQLAELEDEHILLQIENLLNPKIDIWDELDESGKESIQRGIEQLDEGQRLLYQDFIAKYRTTES